MHIQTHTHMTPFYVLGRWWAADERCSEAVSGMLLSSRWLWQSTTRLLMFSASPSIFCSFRHGHSIPAHKQSSSGSLSTWSFCSLLFWGKWHVNANVCHQMIAHLILILFLCAWRSSKGTCRYCCLLQPKYCCVLTIRHQISTLFTLW